MATKLDVNYMCPDYRSYVRVWNNVFFSVKSCNEDKKGLLLLNPEPSNFEFISHYTPKFEEME